MKQMIKTMIPFGSLVLFAGLLSVSLISKDWMSRLFVSGSYFLISLLVALWCASFYIWFHSRLRPKSLLKKVQMQGATEASTAVYGLVNEERSRPSNAADEPFSTGSKRGKFFRESLVFLKPHKYGLVICLAATLLVWHGVGPGFKVLSDETNLLAVAQSMVFKKTIYNTTMGLWYYDAFWPILEELPTRPLLYPYFVHILHILFGYDAAHGFVLNGVLLFGLLTMVYLNIATKYGRTLGLSAVFLILAQPLVSIVATSAGFDLLYCLLLMGSFLLIFDYLNRDNPTSLLLLWMTLLLLANTRYEGIAFFGLIICCILLLRRKQVMQHLRPYLAFYLTTPLLLISRLWQVLLISDIYENPNGKTPFAWNQLGDHIVNFLREGVNLSLTVPYATGQNLLTLVLLIACLLLWAKRRRGVCNATVDCKATVEGLVIGSVVICLSLLIYLGHHIGLYAHPSYARVFLPFIVCMSLGVVFMSNYLRIFNPKTWLSLSIFSFIYYYPVALEGRFSNTQVIIRETNIVLDFIAKLHDPRALFIVERPGQLTVHNYSSVNHDWARNNSQKIAHDLTRHLFSHAYVVERINYEGTGTSTLADVFALETLSEVQNTGTEYLRISKIIRVISSPP